jgi:hypothetical protein
MTCTPIGALIVYDIPDDIARHKLYLVVDVSEHMSDGRHVIWSVYHTGQHAGFFCACTEGPAGRYYTQVSP